MHFPTKIEKQKVRNNMLAYFKTFLETITLKILPNGALKRRKLLNLPIFQEARVLPYFIFRRKGNYRHCV